MKRKMFLATVMSIVLALGMLGQAVAAKGSTYTLGGLSNGGIVMQPVPVPGDEGGVTGLCTYSSIVSSFYTITCANGIKYKEYGDGYTALDSRSVILNNVQEKRKVSLLKDYIDHLEYDMKVYTDGLNRLKIEVNKTYITWGNIVDYSKREDSVGEDARYLMDWWEHMEKGTLETINEILDRREP